MEWRRHNVECFDFFGMETPFLLKNMERALRRVIMAVNKREKIIIYGTCNVDGTVSVALLLLVLKYLNADVEYFISDKIDDSNIKSDIIENHIKFLGAKLIITTGCGIQSLGEIELCKKLGMDVIITDYHKCGEFLPQAIIINPNQPGCKYPFKDLIGVSIVFKLCQAISIYYNMKYIGKYLDLVTIGIFSSGIYITGENEIMVREGMHYLNCTNNYGVKALLKVNKIYDITRENICKLSNNIVSSISSRRYIDNARIAVELFTTESIDRAEQIAKYLKNQIIC